MNHYTELIDQYLSGQMSDSDKQAFEAKLKTDQSLQKEFEAQKQIMKGLQRQGIQTQVSRSAKKISRSKTLKQLGLGLVISLAVLGAIVLVKNKLSKPDNQIRHELNELGNSNWSEADKQLESQVFHINGMRDTIIETQHGIVVVVPAKSFIDKFGGEVEEPFDLEIKEALTPFDIMRAGLNTMSDARALETGGMFYINARSGNDNLSINQSRLLKVSVPASNSASNMMLFDGQRTKDGSINWINPVAMIKQLNTVDILSLNFYPPHFLDSLALLGFDIKNKTLTDSIYYSFIYCNFSADSVARAAKDNTVRTDTTKETQLIRYAGGRGKDGAALFKQNCAVCHSMGTQKLTGPGLAGVANRVPKPAMSWLKAYILNNEKMIKSGDVYANKIYEENNQAAMTVFEGILNDDDMNKMLKYMTGRTAINISDCNNSECPEINPARIKAIWDRKFNNTILATKEFEERLQTIFTTCKDCVFDLYANNLGAPLYELDSTAAGMTEGSAHDKFIEFFKRRDGGVDISDKTAQALQSYIEERTATYAKAARAALEKMYADEFAKDTEAQANRDKHEALAKIRESKTLLEEYTVNLKEAYRQLDKPFITNPPAANYWTASIGSTGWKNVDAYVNESTITRTSLNYKDPTSEKTAKIEYKPIELHIRDMKEYDRVVAYMVPDKLSSFQTMRMDTKGVKESLNELMHYSVVVLGFRDRSVFSYIDANAVSGTKDISLQPTTEDAINKQFSFQAETDLGRELNYQLFEQKETIRHKQIQKREEIRMRLYTVVYPCTPIELSYK
ncbi:MAG: cytochrome c [Bacteroidetes bacterium]|nr:cytochrome c [Bacteroidota bacterium]